MVQVLFDDKSQAVFTTNDKRVHIIWPGFADEDIDSFSFFFDEGGSKLFGTTSDISEGDQVTWHIQTASQLDPDETTKQPLFFQDTSDIDPATGLARLKTLQFVKFPRVDWDQDSDVILMHYWANIPVSDLDAFESSGIPNKFDIMNEADEPFQDDGSIDTTLQRVLAFVRGDFARLFDNREATITLRSPIIFNRPQLVFRPELFDAGNEAEPVLDIHSGGASVFLEFIPI